MDDRPMTKTEAQSYVRRAREERTTVNDNDTTWCEDCGARLDSVGMCPSCIPNSERNADEQGVAL